MNNNQEKNGHQNIITASLSRVLEHVGVFTLCFVIASVLAIAGSIVALVLNLGVGLIVLGISVIVLGIIAAFNTGRFNAYGVENNDDKLSKLSKIGVIILIASLTLGLCSVAFGIAMTLDSKDDEKEVTYTYDFSKQENTFKSEENKHCTLKLSTDRAGFHTVKIKGASLEGIRNGMGNEIIPSSATDDGGESYSVFLVTNLDYFISLRTTGTEFSIEIYSTDEPQ